MYITDPDAPVPTYTVTGKVEAADHQPIADADVRLGSATVKTQQDGTFTIPDIKHGNYTVTASKADYDDASGDVNVDSQDVSVGTLTLNKEAVIETETLRTADMEVAVKKNFPSVYKYTMTKLDGKTMYGQTKDVRVVNINGTDVTVDDAVVSFANKSDTEAVYTLKVKDAAHSIDAVLTVSMVVEANTLHFTVTKIDNNAGENNPSPDGELPTSQFSFGS